MKSEKEEKIRKNRSFRRDERQGVCDKKAK